MASLGSLCFSAWQDRRGKIGDGEIGMARGRGENSRTERARDVDGETSDRRREKKELNKPNSVWHLSPYRLIFETVL